MAAMAVHHRVAAGTPAIIGGSRSPHGVGLAPVPRPRGARIACSKSPVMALPGSRFPALRPQDAAPWFQGPVVTCNRPRPSICRAGEGASAEELAGGAPADEDDPAFLRARFLTFLGITLGYAVYYMTRLSFTYTSPFIIKDLGLDITQVGAITSLFPMAYAFSKVVGGVLGDLFSPRQVFCLALLAAGVLNIAFGFSSSVVAFGALWLINGVFQGLATPQCAKLLTTWFEPRIRGKWWAVWNTSHNIGGAAIPVLAGTAAATLGWRWGMWLPGIAGVVSAAVAYLVISDSPEAARVRPGAGLVAEDGKAAAAAAKAAEESAAEGGGHGDGGAAGGGSAKAKEVLAAVWGSPTMWLLAISYFFVYGGMINWSHFYLLEAKGAVDARAAAVAVSGFEIGGLFGNIAAGFFADWAVANRREGEGAAGKRVQVMVACTVGVLATLASVYYLPPGAGPLTWWCYAAMGFFVYGPQLLVALVATDIVPRHAVATANGFIGWVAYLGATASGWPVTVAVRQYGWDAYFQFLFAGTLVQLLLFLPLWNLKSRAQIEGE